MASEKEGRGGRELVTVQKKAEGIRGLLVSRKAELAAALPRHITADRMVRLALTACSRNPKLLDCTPASFYGSILQASQLGLEVDLLGQAYLVPFYNSKKSVFECQMIPGYQGLLALARRSGEIKGIEARIVREGDVFSYSYGLKPTLEHTPKADATGAMTHVYAVARLKDADPQWHVMTKAEVERHRARSRAAGAGPWVTDYEAMCLKTVLRVLCKLLPASVELATAVRLDEAAEAGIPQDLPLPLEVHVSPDVQLPEALPPGGLQRLKTDQELWAEASGGITATSGGISKGTVAPRERATQAVEHKVVDDRAKAAAREQALWDATKGE